MSDDTRWRVILTDTEGLTGVAPVCPEARTRGGSHDLLADPPEVPDRWDDSGVYDCCPQPHIECWHETVAEQVAEILTKAGAEMCS